MFFDGLAAVEAQRFRNIQSYVFRLPASFLNPFLHDRFIGNNLHARLESLEGHAGETFRVQLAQLVLVIVIIRRAENDAAHATLRDESVFALRRLGGGTFRLIERSVMLVQNVRDGFVLGKPQGVVERAKEQWLDWLALGVFLDAECDAVAV